MNIVLRIFEKILRSGRLFCTHSSNEGVLIFYFKCIEGSLLYAGSIADEYLSFTPQIALEDPLSRPALLGGHYECTSNKIAGDCSTTLSALGSCIALIGLHDGRPLVVAHGQSARISAHVDNHLAGMEKERVIVCLFQLLPVLGRSAHYKGLNGLDAEGFYDGFEVHNLSLWREDGGNNMRRE